MADGTRFSTNEELTRRLAESLRRQFGQYCAFLEQPRTVELMLNPDGRFWTDVLGEGMQCVGTMSAQAAEAFIATVASTLRSVVNRDNPILECQLPAVPPFNGARFEATVPPVSAAPAFSIRVPASVVFTLEEYERQGIMTAGQRQAIEAAVRARHNILVVGGTGTGKTTLLNAIIDYMSEVAGHHRLVILQDLAEIQCAAENKYFLFSTDTVPLQRLLKTTMRLRPDRIIVGEVRGGEALDMLKAWNTGHPGGACSIHANTHGASFASAARAGLIRVEQLIQEVSLAPMQHLIAEAVDIVVSIEKAATPAGRIIREVVAVTGFTDGAYQFRSLEDQHAQA